MGKSKQIEKEREKRKIRQENEKKRDKKDFSTVSNSNSDLPDGSKGLNVRDGCDV